ncbi:MAG: UvrD-helicase domain-containing protein [Myxococcales bacterium]|nr:UvrD-helicase domain-containing protein [Myxococcales bacterium]
MSVEHDPNEPAPNEPAPNEHDPNEHDPNEHDPNEHDPNEPAPNEPGAQADPQAPDAEARRRIREELQTTFVVEAAAGTGKTTALVGRMLAAIAAGTLLERMVALTFTDKAAGELKLRLRERLERAHGAAVDSTQRARFEAALAALELAHVGTIHGFCADLLRARPVEAKVDPSFEVIATDEAEALVARAFDEWFAEILAKPPLGVRRVLQQRRWASSWGNEEGPRDLLRRAASDLIERRDFPAPWTTPERPRRERALECVDALVAFGESALAAPERDREKSWSVKHALDVYAQRRELAFLADAVRAGDDEDALDALEAKLRSLQTAREWGYAVWGWKGEAEAKAEFEAKRDVAAAALEALREDGDEALAASLQLELQPVVGRYEQLKRRTGALDFIDLLLGARDLVRDHPDVRAELQGAFDRIFVDELQDTDPVQCELLMLLASRDASVSDWRTVALEPGKLFAVGDPKQAIYRFRRADLGVYEDVRERVCAAGGEVLHLSKSFRARPSIQRFVDAAFAPTFGEGKKGVQAAYVPLGPARAEATGRPTVIALPVPAPYGRAKEPADYAVQESYPEAVGAFVGWLLRESGWEIPDPTSGVSRPLRSNDIGLLFGRMSGGPKDFAEPYTRALETRGVPYVLQGGRSFYAREEVLALRQALAAIEHPDDKLAVYATLRGPFFGFADVDLFELRARSPLHPFARLPDDAAPPAKEIVDALLLLRALHTERNTRPFADTLARFLEGTRAAAGLAFWPSPRQALASVERVLDRARRFDVRGATSFRAFVDWIEREAERGGAEDVHVEDDAEGVRLMTVHKAKGLELPVIILCEPTQKRSSDRPSRYVDAKKGLWAFPLCSAIPYELRVHADAVREADTAERDRMAYVAATRARELLVLPVVGDARPNKWWLKPLYRAAYPEANGDATPTEPAGCPTPFGHDSVLERSSARLDAGPTRPIRPGAHVTAPGVEVVWWDPAKLTRSTASTSTSVGARTASGGVGAAGASAARGGVAARAGSGSSGAADGASAPASGAGGASAPASGAPGGAKKPPLVGQRALLLDRQSEKSAKPRAKALETYRSWRDEMSARRARASAPSLVVRPVREIALEGVKEGREVVVLTTGAWHEGRPSGARFGTLVHAVLADVPFDASVERVEALARAHGRLLGASAQEIASTATTVSAALTHPLLRRAAEASRVVREGPLHRRLDDGTIVEGVVDLAFLEDDPFGDVRWTVVDYKTDLDQGARDEYVVQVELYAKAIEAATGVAAEAVLLGV